jgi:hypothetical protein
MDYLFKRIETGQYIAYSARFYGPENYQFLDTLFPTEEDAWMYGRFILAWWNSYYPTCYIHGLFEIRVQRELALYDGLVVHTMSSRSWSFNLIQKRIEIFKRWQTDNCIDSSWSAPPPQEANRQLNTYTINSLCDRGELLAREMNLLFANERRVRCCPARNDNCLIQCFLCFLPTSVSKCCF